MPDPLTASLDRLRREYGPLTIATDGDVWTVAMATGRRLAEGDDIVTVIERPLWKPFPSLDNSED